MLDKARSATSKNELFLMPPPSCMIVAGLSSCFTIIVVLRVLGGGGGGGSRPDASFPANVFLRHSHSSSSSISHPPLFPSFLYFDCFPRSPEERREGPVLGKTREQARGVVKKVRPYRVMR